MFIRSLCALALAIGGLSTAALAQGPPPNLFMQYYGGSGQPGEVPAHMYISPGPTPAYVGHTYITYQPFMPHEWLYPHKRTYWTQHGNCGQWTRTSVHWLGMPRRPVDRTCKARHQGYFPCEHPSCWEVFPDTYVDP